MNDRSEACRRGVRIQTLMGEIQGWLPANPITRTLDDLNLASRAFAVVHDPTGNYETGSLRSGPLAINKASILFLTESYSPPEQTAHRRGPGPYARAGVRLRIADFDIVGYVHVPPGGDPMMRLNQSGQPFLALTAASINGPDGDFVTPFLAINRMHILAAQEVESHVEG
jgi:hypothetical protein